MSKPSALWLRARDNCWMTTVNGKQVKLSKDKAEARRLFHKLMAADAPAKSTGVSVRKLLDAYLVKTAELRGADRQKTLARYFRMFCSALGHRRADSLKPFEVDNWLDALPLAESTRALVVAGLKAGFRWAAKQGYAAASPLAAVRQRKFARRSRMLSPETVASVMESLPRDHRDFFAVLTLTGMRPTSEAAKLTAAVIDPALRRASFAEHKNAKKTGKPRHVYFPPAAWEIIAPRLERHPSGPLFRTNRGTAITGKSCGGAVRRACLRMGVEPFPPYVARHYFITSALARGVPVDVLAKLVGNSAEVLRANYEHLGDDSMSGVMADAAARAVS